MLTEAHLQIHRALVGLTGSARLLAAADALSSEIRLGLAHLDRTRANIAQQVREHTLPRGPARAGRVDAALDELRPASRGGGGLAARGDRAWQASRHDDLVSPDPSRNACALAVAAWLFVGIRSPVTDDSDRLITLLVVALLFGVVNEFVRPVVSFLSIPLYLLTLG